MLGTRSIRKRLLLSLALMALVLVGAYLPLLDRLIDRQFESFEINEAQDEARRLELLLNERIERVHLNATDYAEWTWTADYIRGSYPAFVDDNLYTTSLNNLAADYAFIVDREFSIRYFAGTPAYAGSIHSEALQPLPHERLTSLLTDPRFRRLLDQPGGMGLIVRIGSGWHVVGASAITDSSSDLSRPTYGIFGFGYELTPQRMQQIQDLAGLPFTLSDAVTKPEEFRLVDGNVVMHRILRDSRDQPMVALDIRYQQPLAEHTRNTRQLFMMAALGIFVLGAILIWWLIDRGLISRLERLHDELHAVARKERASLSISPRMDEVDELAGGFNLLQTEFNRINNAWRHEALHDALTGLGNRSNLLEQIRSLIADPQRHTKQLCLMLIDLDGFKAVNDLFGHAVGDHVLKQTATSMRIVMPAHAQCFRLGGDEFAVLADDMSAEDAAMFAKKLNQAIRSAEIIGGSQVPLSASIGIAFHPPGSEPVAPGILLQHADVALYDIKRQSRDGHAIFDNSMLDALQRYNTTLHHLRDALQKEKIEAWYQPIVAAISGEVVGFEALARWRDDELGMVDTGQFVAMAEEHFLGTTLDRIVLRKALLGARELRKIAPGVGISVNASVQSLLDPQYIKLVPELLSQSGLKGSDLRIEITETVLAENDAALIGPLAALRARSVRIELDDFGSGHSSLGRLAQIQPRGIKLDGSFTQNRNQDNDRVCYAIIRLAAELGITVTAECVETPADAAFLRDAGCTALQGYMFARPQPLTETLTWLQNYKPAMQSSR